VVCRMLIASFCLSPSLCSFSAALCQALLCHLVIHSPSHNLDPVQSKSDSDVDPCLHLDNAREI
jgi:hypothetical protein